MENRKKFIEKVAFELDIKNPSDWGKVNIHQVYELGGTTLLKKYYKDSLFGCLQAIYKDVEWQREWFSNPFHVAKLYWEHAENHKIFLDKIATHLHIKSPSDWGKVTTRHLRQFRFGNFLKKFYNNSLFTCLSFVYKGSIIHFFILTVRY